MSKATNKQVCECLAQGNCVGVEGGNLFVTGGVLYSYGTHHPLAVWRGGVAYINSAKYSATTSKHRAMVVSALERRGFDFTSVTESGDRNVVAVTMDQMDSLVRNEKGLVR